MIAALLPIDTRTAQAKRAASFMLMHPEGVTHRQITAACDVGSSTKLVSVMRRMGYKVSKKHTEQVCAGGKRRRVGVSLFVLLSEPKDLEPELFES